MLDLWDSFLNSVRDFFRSRGYIEVTTPLLLNFPNLDPNVEPVKVKVRIGGKERTMWLQTSPEYSMKKILAKYKKHIFQIAKCFRNNEWGKVHRVEFHMLEWYRVGADYVYLMDEIEELLKRLGFGECKRLTVEEAFERYLSLPISKDPWEFRTNMEACGYEVGEDDDWETMFQRAYIELAERLKGEPPTFVFEFPEELSALAKVKGGKAERFELFIKGVEIANGWTEETDPKEVRRRLEREAKKRNLPLDEEFIKAHEDMPECAGCSIGLDRLFMVWLGKESLEDVSFNL